MRRGERSVKTTMLVCMVFMMSIIMMCIPAAAESYLKTITIRVESNGDYTYPTIKAGSSDSESRYKIKDTVSWNKEVDNLQAGETIIATLVIVPEEGYEIRLSNGKNSINVRGAEIYSYSRKNSEYTIKIKWIVRGIMSAPENAYWDYSRPWVAKWDKVKNAENYWVQLWHDNTKIASYETRNCQYDFSKELASSRCADEDYVYFRVRACNDSKGIEDSEWTESEEFSEWNDLWYYAKDHGITWNGSNNNYNGPYTSSEKNGWYGYTGYWQYYSNGKIVKNNWVYDGGYWYWLDSNGLMVTGWFQHPDGRWYYMTPFTGGPEGSCMKGWVTINNRSYYFYPSYGVNNGYNFKECEMARNTWIDGFYVGPDGAWTGMVW